MTKFSKSNHNKENHTIFENQRKKQQQKTTVVIYLLIKFPAYSYVPSGVSYLQNCAGMCFYRDRLLKALCICAKE